MTWVCFVLLFIIALMALLLGYVAGRVGSLMEENNLLQEKVEALEKALDEENELDDPRVYRA